MIREISQKIIRLAAVVGHLHEVLGDRSVQYAVGHVALLGVVEFVVLGSNHAICNQTTDMTHVYCIGLNIIKSVYPSLRSRAECFW